MVDPTGRSPERPFLWRFQYCDLALLGIFQLSDYNHPRNACLFHVFSGFNLFQVVKLRRTYTAISLFLHNYFLLKIIGI